MTINGNVNIQTINNVVVLEYPNLPWMKTYDQIWLANHQFSTKEEFYQFVKEFINADEILKLINSKSSSDQMTGYLYLSESLDLYKKKYPQIPLEYHQALDYIQQQCHQKIEQLQ